MDIALARMCCGLSLSVRYCFFRFLLALEGKTFSTYKLACLLLVLSILFLCLCLSLSLSMLPPVSLILSASHSLCLSLPLSLFMSSVSRCLPTLTIPLLLETDLWTIFQRFDSTARGSSFSVFLFLGITGDVHDRGHTIENYKQAAF